MNKSLLEPLRNEIDSIDDTKEILSVFLGLTKVERLVKYIYSLEVNFLLIDICAVDHLQQEAAYEKRFSCHYLFLNLENFERFKLNVLVDDKEIITSIKEFYPIAEVYEDEIYDLFGISFSNREKNKRIFTGGNIFEHPLKKDFNSKKEKKEILISKSETDSKIKLTLEHPIPRNLPDIEFTLEEGLISKTEIKMGQSHLGLEKLFENNDYVKNIALMERLGGKGSFNHSFSYVKTIEEYLDIDLPEKAQAIRMIFSELSRIKSHFQCIGVWAYEILNFDIYSDCNQAREYIFELEQLYSSKRQHSQILLFGGVKEPDITTWHTQLFESLKILSKLIDSIRKNLSSCNTWSQGNRLGKISSKDALENGMTGPNLRACGINYDIRKRFSYYFYNEINFGIPLGIEGSNLDRYLVRSEEIIESISIILQLLDGLPLGEYANFDHQFAPIINLSEQDTYEKISKSLEVIKTKKSVKKGDIYSCIESENGEFGYCLFSDGKDRPYRLHIVAPNMGYSKIYQNLTEKKSLSDAALIYRSINLNLSEIER